MLDPAAAFRFCPRCGREIDGEAGARPFRCGACGFVYYFNAAVSVSAIVVAAGDRDRTLFIRRGHEPGKGMLAFPGGFVDPGEAVEAALAREVREEVGLALHDFAFLASFPNDYHYRGIVYPVADLFFVSVAAQPDQAAALEGVASVCWLEASRVDPAEMAFPSMRAALARFVARCATGTDDDVDTGGPALGD